METDITKNTITTPLVDEQDVYMTDLTNDFPSTITTSDKTDEESTSNSGKKEKQKKDAPIEEVYVQDSEKLLPKRIPVLLPMEKWKTESENLTEDDAVNMGIQICINKHKNKHKKDEKGKMIKYDDTVDKEYNYDRIFAAVAYALMSACPGTTIRGILESTKVIKTTEELT
jgi:hypothetical protein